MAIPNVGQLLRPLLDLATHQDITRRSATTAMSDLFKLSPSEQAERLPSGGSTYIQNRTGWAMSYLTKGGLISKTAPATYRATDLGRTFLERYPTEITGRDLEAIPGWEEAWTTKAKRQKATASTKPSAPLDLTATPQERIETASIELRETLIAELLTRLGTVDPFRFEQVVLDLLVAMGYGGSRKEAAAVTQKTGDEGIDGVINEDRLGLDVIYIQAKRWKGNVGRQEIQSFVGALAGKKASKGVFITTGSFNSNASSYVSDVHQKVILVDGRRLAELMIEHGIGVAEEHAYSVKKIDSDYFEEA
jgi:restriction system protein